ncbi:NSS family neurotransmitter:Na+ symporter [Halospina denitrificans]|uniref:NSS family neurotransmitter:Na+ symporter n=1 Tax=Halospina denitrificans TaxID=332522 RepID=A0A4V3ERI2_9GAMM|nr:sodium-dependent transporter [Halospina denitrificans]TDT43588.1 NSS family neurotransmitter:Na+ symporter [Halospina denitrificans]
MATNSIAPASAWGSRWTFSLALAATVIGLGNLWRVPSAMVNYGGSAFLLVYVAVLFLAVVPVVMAELALARRCLMSPVPTLRRMSEGSLIAPLMPWAGWSMMLAACILLGLYGVVGGMGLSYLFRAALGELNGNPAAASALFTRFYSNQGDMAFWLLSFMALVVGISMKGLQRGLQSSLRTVMPLMLVVILVLVTVGAMSGKAGEASWTLFAFRWEDLGWSGGFHAVSLAFFSLAIGSGALMTLGAYMPGNASVPLSGIGVAATDLAITLLLGLGVISLLFAHQVASVSGFELVFVTLPQVFEAMPSGQLVGSLFYILVVLLAWTSALFVMEVLVARLSESLGGLRALAVALAAIPGCLAGLLAVRGVASGTGPDFFFWMSQLARLLFIPLGVLGVALLVGRFLRPQRVVSFLGLKGMRFRFWRLLMGVVVPLTVVATVGFGLYQQGPSLCDEYSPPWCGGGGDSFETPVYPLSEEPYGAIGDYDAED